MNFQIWEYSNKSTRLASIVWFLIDAALDSYALVEIFILAARERTNTPGQGAVFIVTGLTAIFLVVSLHGLFGSMQMKGHHIIIGRRGIWVKAVLTFLGLISIGSVWTRFDSREVAFTLLISGFISLVFYVAGIIVVRMFLKDIDDGFYENADIDYFPPARENRFLQ